jgi:type IV pilus assembly protein PilB
MNSNGLAHTFMRHNIINLQQVEQLLQQTEQKDISLSLLITQLNLTDFSLIAEVFSQEFGVPFLDISAFNTSLCPLSKVDMGLLEKHQILPLFIKGKNIFIAQADPTNEVALNDIKFNTGLSVNSIVVEYDKLIIKMRELSSSYYDDHMDLDDELENLEIESGQNDDNDDTSDNIDAPVVKFVNRMLLDAFKLNASDIHFEPYEKRYRIRCRVDGILQKLASPPILLAGKIATRIKVMAQLDISERKIPQDGRMKLKISQVQSLDFRVNSLPTMWGEKIVLRILDQTSAQMGIDALGYEEDQKQLYMEALSKPQGLVLVTGPTGSGKTVSLYTGLNILNTEDKNISTVEDPVEINLEGINQVSVNQKTGMDFGLALRAFLRQDPDVIMIGEIRDLNTASIAIKASQTGHLVLSTLHTNSASETLMRLVNMGVPIFNLATSISLIIAQRLGRRLCESCKEHLHVSDDVLLDIGMPKDLLEQATIYNAIGCHKCTNGYKGRVGVYEVVKITPPISKIILDKGTAFDISRKIKEEGFRSLRHSALIKVSQGILSLEEANRITPD